jgi:hypothetical protein
MISILFEDKRLMCIFLLCWLTAVLICFADLGVLKTDFMSLGPSEHTFVMGMAINSWYRWWWVAFFTFCSTAINDFVGDSIVPWIQNTVQDHKTRYLPYSKFTCWGITQAYSMYSCTMSIFGIFLLLSQLDFMLIRMLADSVVNVYTAYSFMKHKKTNVGKYNEWKNRFENHDSDDDGIEIMTEGAYNVPLKRDRVPHRTDAVQVSEITESEKILQSNADMAMDIVGGILKYQKDKNHSLDSVSLLQTTEDVPP